MKKQFLPLLMALALSMSLLSGCVGEAKNATASEEMAAWQTTASVQTDYKAEDGSTSSQMPEAPDVTANSAEPADADKSDASDPTAETINTSAW